MAIRKQNIFNTAWAVVKFAVALLLVLVQLPIIILLPRGRISAGYMRIFMRLLIGVFGLRVRAMGGISSKRPLLVISNHISVFEIATFPVIFRGSFVAKKDVEHYPLIGAIAKKFGVIFIDRRPSHALDALVTVQREISRISYPLFLFPEGTTTNGAYVKAFKSTLFNIAENSDVTVQPVVMHYRFRDGSPISDDDLAQHYGYFDNAKQDQGPYCARERNLVAQLFHILVIGGFDVYVRPLPPIDLRGMNRKEIALKMHDIISEKYMELKDKKETKK